VFYSERTKKNPIIKYSLKAFKTYIDVILLSDHCQGAIEGFHPIMMLVLRIVVYSNASSLLSNQNSVEQTLVKSTFLFSK